MNTKKVVIVGAGFVALLMALIPPWRTANGPAGYGPIWNPSYTHDEIDLLRLIIQLIIIAGVAGLLVHLSPEVDRYRQRDRRSKWHS